MTVLAAVAGERDTPVVQIGSELATHAETQLEVVHVAGRGESERETPDARAERAADVARAVIDDALAADSSARPVGRAGEPISEILALVDEREPQYLVVGSRKRSAVGKAVFGSTTQSVLLRSSVPTVGVPLDVERVPESTGPVVAAVDRSALGGTVARTAARLATQLGRPLHLVHVLPEEDFYELTWDSVDETGRMASMDEIRAFATELAADAGEALGGEYEAVGLVGRPSTRLMEYAADHDVSYVVTGRTKRSRTGKALFGSVTQRLLLESDLPVVTVRDSGD